MEKFILFWGSVKIGTLTETDKDMRNGGIILFNHNFINKEENYHLLKYIEHSIKACTFLENGDDISYKQMCEDEKEFHDLINSSKWMIESKEGKRITILCPVFLENNGITWQKVYY